MSREKQIEMALKRLDLEEQLENLENADAAPVGGGNHANRPHDQRKHKTTSASITFLITRQLTKTPGTPAYLTDGNGQAVSLPAPIFGVLEYESLYSRVLAAFLPKDGSILVKSVAKSADNQFLIIVYKNATDTINETITIKLTNSVYTNLLRGMMTSEFKIDKPKMIIDDSVMQKQFNEPIGVFHGSMYTASSTDSISPNDYKTDVLSDNTVRILNDIIGMEPEKTLIPGIVQPIALAELNKSFTFSIVCKLTHISCGC